jgi:hypothetical protein
MDFRTDILSKGAEMSPLLIPTRYRITADQLAAALKLAGLKPTKRAGLTLPPPHNNPVASLRDANLLAPDESLTAEAAACLAILADPARQLSVRINDAGEASWRETLILRGADQGGLVARGTIDNGGFDLAFLATPTQAAVLLDDVIGLTALAALPGAWSVDLELPAYAALLASADLIQAAMLRARMERTDSAMPVLTVPALEEQLKLGIKHHDTRWAVSAGSQVCPVQLAGALGKLNIGAKELSSLGFLGLVQGNYILTAIGQRVVATLGQIVRTAGLSVTIDLASGSAKACFATIFRTATAIWVAVWISVTAESARVRFFETDGAGGVGLLWGLLESSEADTAIVSPDRRQPTAAATSEKTLFCTNCGTRQPPDSDFCDECGEKLD